MVLSLDSVPLVVIADELDGLSEPLEACLTRSSVAAGFCNQSPTSHLIFS